MKTVIGLEIHAQLDTATKLFCGCSTDYFGAEPNTHCCPVCLGMPGALPVTNQHAIELAVKAGLAVDCEIPEHSKFDRKNYFYPDLPKGYQISQFDEPVAQGGHVDLELENGTTKRIKLTRIHIEEDAGKTIHVTGKSRVDLNRCGIPLIEIVTEPDLSSPEEAGQFMRQLRQLMRYAGVSSADMEKGEMRCDANISISQNGELGTKTELKNINSFKAVEDAIIFEDLRQREKISDGKEIIQQTFGWNADKNRAEVQRSKEDSDDYRYFPDPDLARVHVGETWRIQIENEMPELPVNKRSRWKTQYQLPSYDINLLTEEPDHASYFEEVIEHFNNPKQVSNWMMSELLRLIKESDNSSIQIEPKDFAHVLQQVDEGKINRATGKEVIEEAFKSGKSPAAIIESQGHSQISDESAILELASEVISENPDAVSNFKDGNENSIGFLVGQLMAKTRGQANPKIATQVLRDLLSK
jgi:aspartyl-tRNA(Asn)/glutamyl-tRNA(Gln) amidotransferase subunit B